MPVAEALRGGQDALPPRRGREEPEACHAQREACRAPPKAPAPTPVQRQGALPPRKGREEPEVCRAPAEVCRAPPKAPAPTPQALSRPRLPRTARSLPRSASSLPRTANRATNRDRAQAGAGMPCAAVIAFVVASVAVVTVVVAAVARRPVCVRVRARVSAGGTWSAESTVTTVATVGAGRLRPIKDGRSQYVDARHMTARPSASAGARVSADSRRALGTATKGSYSRPRRQAHSAGSPRGCLQGHCAPRGSCPQSPTKPSAPRAPFRTCCRSLASQVRVPAAPSMMWVRGPVCPIGARQAPRPGLIRRPGISPPTWFDSQVGGGRLLARLTWSEGCRSSFISPPLPPALLLTLGARHP